MNSNFRNLAIWVIIALLLVALFNLFQSPGQRGRANEISYSEFLNSVEAKTVGEVTIKGTATIRSIRDLIVDSRDDLRNDVDVANLLLEEVGVALVPGSAFGAPGYMRLSFATSMENLEQAVERIGKVFGG